MGKIIQVGIVGYGLSGRVFHAPFIVCDNRFFLKKVVERTTSNAKERYPFVEVVRSFDELLLDKELDLIILGTPTDTHFEMAKKAMEAGKNVIIDKPFTSTSEEADGLIEISKQTGKLLSVYQNRRYDGDFKTIQKIIENGYLGEVLEFESHFDRYALSKSKKEWKEVDKKGNGLIYDLGTHLVDQAVTLFGVPNEIYADLRCLRDGCQINDAFEIILYYQNNLKAILKASLVVKEHDLRFAVHGRNGSYIKNGIDIQEDVLNSGAMPNEAYWGEEDPKNWGVLQAEINGLGFYGKIKTMAGNYAVYYDNIYKVMTEDAELDVKPSQARNVIKLIELAEESNQVKSRLKVEL